MRIDFVSFLCPEHYRGGGEMVTRRLVESGRQRGHDIRIASMRPYRREGHDRPALTLFADVFNHAHSYRSLGAWRGFPSAFLEAVMARAPFVHLTNAYADVCNLPYLPCSGEPAPRCPAKAGFSKARQVLLRDWGEECFARRKLVRRLYAEAALNVFMSPLHKAVSEKALAFPVPGSFILRPLIDTALFRDEGRERDIDYLFVGVIGEAKGLAAMRERFADSDITVIGRLAPGETLDFGRHLGHVPYDEIPGWMNRARNFVFLPRWPEPQGRVVAEAALSGCRIIGNERVGALSFDFDLADPASYQGVEEEFWRTVEILT